MNVSPRECDLSCDPTDARRLVVSGPLGVKLATDVNSDNNCVTTDGGKCSGGVATQSSDKISIRNSHRLGTWNVRGLLGHGKLTIVESEMTNHKISILGVCETHMRGQGYFKTGSGNIMYFSGPEDESRNGVAFILPQHINKHVLGYNPVTDRIITLKLNTKPCIVNLVQIYAPTAQADENCLEDFYGSLANTLESIPNREITIILGDWNAKIGATSADDHIRNVVGKFGLGVRNERGEKLLEMCIERKLSIMNTFFQHHPRRMYTWRSPGDRYRNQIDYIMINNRWKSSICNTKTFPGADCGSDHNLLVAWFALRLKIIKRTTSLKPRQLDPLARPLFREYVETKLKPILQCNEHPNQQWESLKTTIFDGLNQHQPKHTEHRNKTWLSDRTWKLVQNRKDLKCKGLQNDEVMEQYSTISKDIKRSSRQDMNNFILNLCREVESHALKMQPSDLFKKVRMISRQFKPKSWIIEDKDGKPLHELDKVVDRWREYCEDLYRHHDTHTDPSKVPVDLLREPPILRSEVTSAIAALKNRKAPGPDEITAEILKTLGDAGIDMLHNICNGVWTTTEWPRDWTKSVILPLHKKGSTKKCDNYRTLSLISHASKILLQIINARIRHYLDWQIPQEQAGFVKGKGTREQILNVRQLIEKANEFNVPFMMCFVDYSKAFDCVNWKRLWEVLNTMGVPKHLILLLQGLYLNSQGTVRIEAAVSKSFSFGKGVRQGCILSPILFNIYGEHIIRQTCEDWEGGININGTKITNLRYADDTILLAANETELCSLFDRMERNSKDLGLSINRSKTKVMVVDRASKLTLSGTHNLEIVNNFIYLGSTISNTGSCEDEIRRRIGMSKSAMSQLERIWKDRKITNKTKIALVSSLVFSIFLYGAETWTLKTADRKRIDAFEMWCWRKLLRIPWTARRTNKSVLEELKIAKKPRLSNICLRRIFEFFGHIARKPGDDLQKLIVTGIVDGKRPRGRSPMRWSDQIRSTLSMNVSEAVHVAENRSRWRNIVKKKVIS